jgi:2-polyprenyl-3-methyl-5-hydroxy-6-metoxy-1,4-benzoquinol methylase
MTPNPQQEYFDNPKNQFPSEQLTKPILSQQLEMGHLLKALHPLSGSTVLDFGAGTGRFSLFFLSKGFDVIAYDISKKSLNVLKKTYFKSKTSAWGNLKTISYIPKNLKIDNIVGGDILHHVSLDAVFPLFFSHLKPNGKVAFSEPNPLNLSWYLVYLAKHIPWEIESGITKCTRRNLFDKLSAYSFVNISFHPHGLLPTRLLNSSKLLSGLNAYYLPALFPLYFISYRNIITAQKAG